jgi:hypothetical protein
MIQRGCKSKKILQHPSRVTCDVSDITMATAKDGRRVFSVRVGKPFFFEETGRFGDEPDP